MDNNGQSSVPAEQTVDSANDVTIDLGRIFRALLHYIWVIVIAIVLGAVIMFGYTKLFVEEKYTSSATIYVSNASSNTVTSSDSNVATVVSTVIQSRDTIKLALETSGLDSTYSISQVSSALSVSVGSAGILTFSVELNSGKGAYDVANALIDALDVRAKTTEGSENIFKASLYYSVVTYPVQSSSPSSPDTTKNVLIGAVAGAAVAVVVIVLIELLNNKIYDNDYLLSTYNIPILAEIPDFGAKNKSKKYYSSYGYGYGTKKS